MFVVYTRSRDLNPGQRTEERDRKNGRRRRTDCTVHFHWQNSTGTLLYLSDNFFTSLQTQIKCQVNKERKFFWKFFFGKSFSWKCFFWKKFFENFFLKILFWKNVFWKFFIQPTLFARITDVLIRIQSCSVPFFFRWSCTRRRVALWSYFKCNTRCQLENMKWSGTVIVCRLLCVAACTVRRRSAILLSNSWPPRGSIITVCIEITV